MEEKIKKSFQKNKEKTEKNRKTVRHGKVAIFKKFMFFFI
jgi:hypothetical protein